MTEAEHGPGPLSSELVGQVTIANSFELTARRIMAYGAAIGDTSPQLFDDLRSDGLVGHPFMSCSFQWNSRFMPQVPTNHRATPYTVHAWTDLRLNRPFRQGDLITTQGQVVLMEQIKPGVHQLTRYTMKDGHGETVAELDYAGITRGATLSDGAKRIAGLHEVPRLEQSVSNPIWTRTLEIRPDAGQVYTECADIYNPIHTERTVATEAGLPDIILHGSATQAMSATAVIEQSLGGDVSAVRRYAGQLRAMVLMGTTITVRGWAERVTPQGEREVFFDVLNAHGDTAVAGGYIRAMPST